jgi:hypothetical protein
VQTKAIALNEVPEAFPLERDPKDEPYLDLAIAAGADYLVSRDLDLLDLMKDGVFQARYPNLTILDPTAFLQAIAREQQVGQACGKEAEKSSSGESAQRAELSAEEETGGNRPSRQWQSHELCLGSDPLRCRGHLAGAGRTAMSTGPVLASEGPNKLFRKFPGSLDFGEPSLRPSRSSSMAGLFAHLRTVRRCPTNQN